MSYRQILVYSTILLVCAIVGVAFVLLRSGPPTDAEAHAPQRSAPLATDAREAEIIKLREENRRLLQQRAEHQQQSPAAGAPSVANSPTAASQSTGSVSGSAWLVRNDGSSDLLRGLQVGIVKPTVPTTAVSAKAMQTVPMWEDIIASYQEMIRDSEGSIRQFGDRGGYWQQSIQKDEATIQEYQNIIRSIRSFSSRAGTGREMDTLAAYRFLISTSPTGGRRQKPVVQMQFETKTDADGQYSFKDIPPGSYYVFAMFETGIIWITWMLPIVVQPGEHISLDLYNDSAELIRTIR